MPRYAFRIEYDGRPFAGWQRQADQPSVQQSLEEALGKLQQSEPRLTAAGRTDAGVHAIGQVASVDLERSWEPFRLAEALNWHLKPAPVAITACAEVEGDFSARFSAQSRSYTYRLISRRAPVVHGAGQVWQVRGDLDVAAMAEGAQHLLGKHDFTTFRAVHCQAQSPVKTLDECQVEEVAMLAGREIRFHLNARSFLHNQVRSIVGTLERVGAGSWDPADVKTALDAADRSACGPVAPPDGLFLRAVGYPDDPFETGWREAEGA